MKKPGVDSALQAVSKDYEGQATSPLHDLAALRLFVRVVEAGSFSEVARRSGVTSATISKHIAALEAGLQVRLLNRTTRQHFITDAGQRLYTHARLALEQADRVATELADLHDQPTGHLRVTAPLQLGLHRISPWLPGFLKAHERITVDLSLSVDKVDLYKERIDLAVRIADDVEPGFIAIELAPYRRLFCASPEYLERHGTPRTPEDLAQHNCLVSRAIRVNDEWQMTRNGLPERIRVHGNMSSDNGEVMRHAALGGTGIILTACWMVADDLAQGRLVQVLPDYSPEPRKIYAVLLQRTDSSRKLAAFVAFLRDAFADLK